MTRLSRIFGKICYYSGIFIFSTGLSSWIFKDAPHATETMIAGIGMIIIFREFFD